MRLTAALVAVLGGVLALSACGSASSRSTELRIRISDPSSQTVLDVRCDPPGGDVSRPAAVCRAIEARPWTMLLRVPYISTCVGGLSTGGQLLVEGRFHGQRVRRSTGACDWPVGAASGAWREIAAGRLPTRDTLRLLDCVEREVALHGAKDLGSDGLPPRVDAAADRAGRCAIALVKRLHRAALGRR